MGNGTTAAIARLSVTVSPRLPVTASPYDCQPNRQFRVFIIEILEVKPGDRKRH
jgi:hypothetical protein